MFTLIMLNNVGKLAWLNSSCSKRLCWYIYI